MARFLKPGLLIGFGTGLLILFLSGSPTAVHVENQAFDTFTRWTSNPLKWPDDIVLLTIDEASLQKLSGKYGWRWPWPREAHAALIAYLKKAGARAIVFDILFTEDSEDAIQDDRFATYIKATDNVWLVTKQIKDGPVIEPIASLKEACEPHLGFVNINKDPDGIIRNYPLYDVWNGSTRKPIALALALPPTPALSKRYREPQGKNDGFILRWYTQWDQLDEKHLVPAGSLVASQREFLDAAIKEYSRSKKFNEFDPHQIVDILERVQTPEGLDVFADKVVFIGGSATATFDAVATPLSGFQPGVIVHATALANIMRGDYLRPVPAWTHALLIIFSSGVVTFICQLARTIRWQSILTVLALLLIFGASYLLFERNYWLPPLMALFAGFLSYTGITTYNYFVEGKLKRQYKQLFSDFVSPDVLAELQQSPNGLNLNGDSRMGTVLFCDLAGFTAFTETASPEQLISAINTYLSEASKVLLAHGAYIDKFIGDAVMAIFSIPKVQPDHAVQACLAALELQMMMMGLNQELGRRYNVKLSLRTGVNSGVMIAGPMGYARKLNYSALGDTVNLASRFESANKEYHTHTMIGPLTYELARDTIETRPLDYLRVKGKHKSVRVYEVMARKGELHSDQVRLRAAYHEGLELYHQRHWKDAKACFERALAIQPGDGPSQTYLQRCDFYQKTPPSSDWDGSFGLDTK